MAGRLILITLVCAVSGLLVTALASTKGLYLVLMKPAVTGALCWNVDDRRLETEQMSAMDWRSSLKTASLETDWIRQERGEAPKGASERSIGKENPCDPALVISVESLMRRQKTLEAVTLVDVRDHRAFQQCRIPGSINVPLFALRTKKYLASRFVVLVNEGFLYTQMAERCRQLRTAGFLVWMLEGGLAAWSEAGGALEGDHPAQGHLNRISARDLFEERGSSHWVAVDARQSQTSKESVPFSRIIPMGSPENKEELIAALVDYQKQAKGKPPLSFVVFDEDGQHYEYTEKTIKKAGIKHAFYLIDGLAGYKAFMTQSAAVLRKEDPSRRTIGRCADCP